MQFLEQPIAVFGEFQGIVYVLHSRPMDAPIG